MKTNKNIWGDYLKLFLRREGIVVLGKNFSNVWLLTSILTVTLLAVAFSNGSLIFLEDKMNDPFINWVDIKNDNQDSAFANLEAALSDDQNALKFDYKGYEYGYEFSYFYFGKEGGDHEYLKCRFFTQLNSELVDAILKDDNVVNGWKVESIYDITENSIGLIITEKALNSLGYTEAPAYIDLYSYSIGAEELGIDTYNERARAPLPVLGVVKRLPGNVDIISSSRFYEQNWNSIYTFNLCKEDYAKSLCYFVPSDLDVAEFEADMTSALSECTDVEFVIDTEGFYPDEQFSFKHRVVKGGQENYATYVRMIVTDTLEMDYFAIKAANEKVMDKYACHDVHRLYPYMYDPVSSSTGAYLSVHFNNLNTISDFQSWVNEFGVEIEMSQINAKENFNSVRLMAGVLSWAIIFFAVICILLFIVNLLKSYFQKVKRNIGTFKAFGISNKELIVVYLLIIGFLVGVSLIISFVIVLVIQELLPVFGIMKEGVYNYLSLFSIKTTCSMFIIIVSSLFLVYRLMSNMLKATPGDLIYDR